MNIEKVINNNVISVLDQDGKEIIVMGGGVGFHKKKGDAVDPTKIEKRFVLEDESTINKFTELVKNIPQQNFNVAVDIIDYANQVMQKRLSSTIYLALTDHINFTVERFSKGIIFPNPLLEEVKSFYPSEYLVGEYAVALIERRIGLKLPVDEAASIALHLVNAECSGDMSETMNITVLIRKLIELVQNELGVKLDDMGLHYSRFVTHLKFFAQRLFAGQMLNNQEQELTDMIMHLYPREYEISKKIGEFVNTEYEKEMTAEEAVYLAVHIRRIQPNVDEDK